MLTLPQIKKYLPDLDRPEFDKFVLIEYLQCEILDSIFKQKLSENISFIGGTAIRIVHGNSRFSEDLDFDNFGLSFADFDKIITNTSHDLQNKGFETEFRTIEQGAYHCYLKFPKILYNLNLSPLTDQKILVKIDMTEQKALAKANVYRLDKFGISTNIITNPANILLSQKMIAAIERKTPKGRDFFDISFLYSFEQPNYEYIKVKTQLNKYEFIKHFGQTISSYNFSSLSRDVAPFLIRADQIERVTRFPELFKAMLLQEKQ